MTGKENLMKWENIEHKWAVMTRRIRADYAIDRIEPTDRSEWPLKSGEVLSATIADNMTATAEEPEFKTTAK